MIQALLHGKLSREQANMEDLLTSAVFGRLGYMPPQEGLLPFLRLARDRDGNRLLADLPDGTETETEFWRWLTFDDAEPCEPDVLVKLTTPDNRTYRVMVEAKFRSGKSSESDSALVHPHDQLAREWDNLTRIAGADETPLLVYLTADVDLPADDIRDSIRESLDKRAGSAPTILWLSWRHLYDVLDPAKGPMHADLLAALKRLNLYYFRGVNADMGTFEWRFQ